MSVVTIERNLNEPGFTNVAKRSGHENRFSNTGTKHATSNFDTAMHIFKGNIGSGFLAIPFAFKSSGLAFGTFGLFVVATVCVHCMQIVVRCSTILAKRVKMDYLDLALTAEVSFATGPQMLRKFASSIRYVTNIYLCLTQLGFCSVYFLLVSNNVKQIIDKYYPEVVYVDYRIYALAMLVPVILLNIPRTLKFLTPASAVANILQAISICIIFYYLCRDFRPVSSRKQFTSARELPLWFGTVIYSFEGIGLVLPLRNKMKRPGDFGGLTGVLNCAMCVTSCLFIAMGFYGYLEYGDSVLGNIPLNLPQELLADSVRVMFSIATFLSYPIQFYVPIQVMWPSLEGRVTVGSRRIALVAFKILMIVVTFSFAVLVPQLGLFISLIGAFAGSYLSLILPPILELITFWSKQLSLSTIVKDVVILLAGILGLISGTVVSLDRIVTTFGETE